MIRCIRYRNSWRERTYCSRCSLISRDIGLSAGTGANISAVRIKVTGIDIHLTCYGSIIVGACIRIEAITFVVERTAIDIDGSRSGILRIVSGIDTITGLKERIAGNRHRTAEVTNCVTVSAGRTLVCTAGDVYGAACGYSVISRRMARNTWRIVPPPNPVASLTFSFFLKKRHSPLR